MSDDDCGFTPRDIITLFFQTTYLGICLFFLKAYLPPEDSMFFWGVVFLSTGCLVPRLFFIAEGCTNFYHWEKDRWDTTIKKFQFASPAVSYMFVVSQTAFLNAFKFKKVADRWTTVYWFTFFYCYVFVGINTCSDLIMFIRWKRRISFKEAIKKEEDLQNYINYM